MWVQETEKAYIYHCECDRAISKKAKKTYEIADGLRVTFRKRTNAGNKLCNMIFEKEWFSQDEADAFWSEIEIRLLDKKNSWSKKLPLLSFAIDTGDGNILVGHFRGLPRSETLKKQYEEMVESDEDVVDGLYSEILDTIEGEEYEYGVMEFPEDRYQAAFIRFE